MINTKAEALSFARESEAAYVRLGFCDPFGRQKDISIMQGELEAAFERGVAIDGSAIPGFCDVHRSDLLIFPDPSSLRVLPWRPGPGRVLRFYCDIRRPDGSPFSGDSRRLLK
ncbi:MAG: glutamine synthetase, partial [Clostridiales bacterium]|nr:glutamine synthetase [Clostridiales bacterium]